MGRAGGFIEAHPSHQCLPFCFALTSSLRKSSPPSRTPRAPAAERGRWDPAWQRPPGAGDLPGEAQRLVPRKCHRLSPDSSWHPAQHPPSPVSGLSVTERRSSHALPCPASPARPPPRPLRAPGSCEAVPDELALSLALAPGGKAALCLRCQDADEEEEPSPHRDDREGQSPQRGARPMLTGAPALSCPLGVPASPTVRIARCLYLPAFFPESHRTGKMKTFLRVILYKCLPRQRTETGVEQGGGVKSQEAALFSD